MENLRASAVVKRFLFVNRIWLNQANFAEAESTIQCLLSVLHERLLTLEDLEDQLENIRKLSQDIGVFATLNNWDDCFKIFKKLRRLASTLVSPFQRLERMCKLAIFTKADINCFLVYVKHDNVSDDAKKALKSFVRTGKTIRNGRTFSGSFYKKMEVFLRDRNRFGAEIFSAQSARSVVMYKYESSFLALAAPSMEGKTQFAFVCQDPKPIYFPISQVPVVSQPIYENFKNLAATLLDCAADDLKFLGGIVPSATNLKESTLGNIKLFTLGFLKGLVDNVEVTRGKTWMEALSECRSFSFAPISIIEYSNNKFLDGYLLFLDEFVSRDLNKLVRNIARAIGNPIVLANTNTKVANMVDRSGAQGSGSAGGEAVWSTVVTKLDPASIDAFDLLSDDEARDGYLPFTQAFEKLLSWFPQHSNRMRSFLLELRDVHFEQLRPGIAAFLAEIIKNFAKNEPLGKRFTVGAFLDYVLPKLAENLKERKKDLVKKLGASFGQIALLLPESYNDYLFPDRELKKKLNKSWRQPRFLEEHLFYLKNPHKNANKFLTFAASDSNNSLLLERNRPWTREYTVFRPEEHFTFLGCLFLPFAYNVGMLFYLARKSNSRRNTSVVKTLNPESLFLNGNSLEVQAAVAISRASHYQFGDMQATESSVQDTELGRVFSCTGHDGLTFFQNLVYELLAKSLVGFENLKFSFDPKLRSFLQGILIPFLYGINHENSLLKKYSTTGNTRERDLYARQYERTSNAKQIDGKFSARKAGVAREIVVACECKNRKDKVDASLLEDIMVGFIKNNAKLGIVVCKRSVESPHSTSQFAIDCANHSRHIYRLAVKKNKVNFKQFYRKAVYENEPFMVVIILETSVINEISNMS